MSLPQMSEDVAEAILDWIDADDDIRPWVRRATTTGVSIRPYDAKNGPLDTIEELLLVRGVTPELLFGLDANHNGVIDREEKLAPGASAIDPELQLGWASYITLYSKEHNVNARWLKRININSEDLEQLSTDLRSRFDQRMTDFIIAYRQNGPYTGTDEPVANAAGELDFSIKAKQQFFAGARSDRCQDNGQIHRYGKLPSSIKSPIDLTNLVCSCRS